MTKKWYHNWFNSPYYHILYHQRNDEEAEFFIDNLCAFLHPSTSSRLLDAGCGRGRHSVYLNKKGYDVTGIDLSLSNIKFAQQFQNDRLHFYTHDMRHLMNINYFDIVLNLFTSFGFFNTEKEHIQALQSFNKGLKKNGLLILDYFNREKIIRHLVGQELKEIEDIEFHITKTIKGDKIIKTIAFEHRNKDFAFQEEVKAFSLSDFEQLFKTSNFEIVHQFGDYALNPFDEEKSDRIIFICRKTNA